jgi:hypothetical protein
MPKSKTKTHKRGRTLSIGDMPSSQTDTSSSSILLPKRIKNGEDDTSNSDQTQLIDDAINAVLSQNVCSLDNTPAPSPSGSKTNIVQSDSDIKIELNNLRNVVKFQSQMIIELTKRVNFLMSAMIGENTDIKLPHDITTNAGAKNTSPSSIETGAGPMSNVNPIPSTSRASNDTWSSDIQPNRSDYSEIVKRSFQSKKPTLLSAIKESVVTAVYIDNKVKDQRSSSIVVSGIKQDSTTTDKLSITTLFTQHLNISPDIVSTKRLGKPIQGKIQPVLVTFHHPEQAQEFIVNAKKLRLSEDQYVRNNVYINQYLTKAESLANFELRVKRRERQLQRQQQADAENHQISE